MPPPHSRQPPLSQLDARVLSAAGAGRPDLLEAVLAGGGSANAGPDFCGDSPLLLAARGMLRGHIECCRLLLTAGGDPNWRGSRGETAVMVAVQGGSEALLEVVLTPGANLALRTDGGLSAFQLASLHRRPAMLARLLQHQRRQLAEAEGAGADGVMGGPQAATAAAAAAAGRQLVLAVYAAIAGGEPRCLQELVSDPLTRAAYSRQFAPLGGVGSSSGTAVASSSDGGAGSTVALQQLQPPGAAPAGPPPLPPPPPQGLPVPHQQHRDREAEERLQDELSFLLDPEIVGAHNSRPASFLWQTSGMPSHLAAALNQAECLHILLSSALCPVDERTADGFTPLMLAATADATAAAAVLLQRGGALEARNHASRTPAFLAAVSGSAGALELLIRAGADVNAAEDTRGCPPLSAAIARAAAFSTGTSAPRAAPFLRCAALLLGAGARLGQPSKDGGTALHAAAEAGSLACLELLLQHKQNSSGSGSGGEGGSAGQASALEAVDSAGRTPLARAAAAGRPAHRDCILYLLGQGAAVNSAELASKVLDCLLGGADGTVVTVWQLLPRLSAYQLRVLTGCPKFYDLAHSEAPQDPLPATAVDAMLELAAEGCSNLLYHVCPSENAAHGRRPAYLFELLRRAADSCRGGSSSSGAHCPGDAAWWALREAVGGSPHVAKLLSMWASSQCLLQYASCIARCRGVPQADREQLSVRVGHLFSAYHSLGVGLCQSLGFSLTAGVRHPSAPLAASSAAALGEGEAPRVLAAPNSLEESYGVAVPEGSGGVSAMEEEEGEGEQGAVVQEEGEAVPAAAPMSEEEEEEEEEEGDEEEAEKSQQDAEEEEEEDEQEGDTVVKQDGGAELGADASGPGHAAAEPLPMDADMDDAPAVAPVAAAEAPPGGPAMGSAPAAVAAAAAAQPAPSSSRMSGPTTASWAHPPVSTAMPEAASDATSSTQQAQQAQQQQEEAAIGAALLPFADAVEELVCCIADQAQLRSWHFLLEYREVVSLACKQRLLLSLIAAWPRRQDSQLSLNTERQGVLQRVCTEVELQRSLPSPGGGSSSMGGALWHGIKVAFEQEHGVGDGVRREWFRLLAAELTNPDTGLFESHGGGASFAPAPHASVQCDEGAGSSGSSTGINESSSHLQKFELVGCMLGLGLMQSCTLPGFALTSATWRAVLDQPPRPHEDLAAADPLLNRNLQFLRGMGPAVADLGLHFEQHDALGRSVELCPGGARQLVTAGSVERYIALLARYKMVDSLAAESAALAKGLRGVLTGGVVDILGRCFTHAELNCMVAGLAELALPDWQAHTRYERCGPFTDQVAWLWAALEAADQPRRRQLLAFVTGSASLPAGGFAALRGFNGALHPFTVCVVATEGDDRLPRASTCFNTLFLPAYSCPAALEARLWQAAGGEQSFDEAVIRRG